MNSILKNAGAFALLWLASFNTCAQAAGESTEGAQAEAAQAQVAQAEGAQAETPQSQAAQTGVIAADPAVWGPYARLVGRNFVGEDVAGWPGYASKTRSIQWEEPGKVMVETSVQANGTAAPKMRILPGKRAGELVFDVERAPNATATVVDADTIRFDQVFGYSTTVRVSADGYDMQVMKRDTLQAHATYRDANSTAQQQRNVELAEKAVADKHAAMLALRAAGVPDEPTTELPADRVLAYQEPVRGPSGTLRITRGKAWEAGACFAAVYINGRWAGRFEDAETATFKVPAGKVQVGVGSDPKGRGTCRVGGDAQTVHDTVIAKGESVHVYFAYNGGPQFKEALLAPASPQSTAAQ